MPRMFVISRYDDTADLRDRMVEQLRERYGAGSVVSGVSGSSLPDYLRRVEEQMRRCHVVLVVMGPSWTQVRDAHGYRLLDNPYDPVRVELRTALAQQRLIMPLLLHGAQMPRAEDLPPDIAPLAWRQGFQVRNDPEFADDMRVVYQQINTQLTWRPASLFVLSAATCAGLAQVVAYATADLSFGAGTQGKFASLLFGSFFVSLFVMLGASTAGILLSVLRRGWGWLVAVCAGLFLLVAVASLPVRGYTAESLQLLVLFPLILLNALVLVVFGLFGPRRETAGVRQRTRRAYAPAAARSTSAQ